MKEELISFETAKLAKEVGFECSVSSYYKNGKLKHKRFSTNVNGKEEQAIWDIFGFEIIAAPAQSLLQRWLREKYKLHIHIADLGLCMWSFMITELSVDGTQSKGGDLGKKNYNTYEQALEAGLLEALKLIKT